MTDDEIAKNHDEFKLRWGVDPASESKDNHRCTATENLVEHEIGGGDVIHLGWPVCVNYLVSYATQDKFVLVSDPAKTGSLLKTKHDGDYLWTKDEIFHSMRMLRGSQIMQGTWKFAPEFWVTFGDSQ